MMKYRLRRSRRSQQRIITGTVSDIGGRSA
jgi:hypothetical protein